MPLAPSEKTHTHTHPFNGPLSRTTRVSRNQKCKANLDFTEARDSEWQWHQLGHMQVCISIQTDNHASTQLLRFLQAGCPSCRPANSVKALKAQGSIRENIKVKSADNYWRVVRVIEIGGTSVRTSAVYDITVRVRFQLVRVRVVLQLPCCIPGTIATAAAAAAYHCNVTAMCNLIPASDRVGMKTITWHRSAVQWWIQWGGGEIKGMHTTTK